MINSLLVALEMDVDAEEFAEELEDHDDVVRADVLEVEAKVNEEVDDD